jgi:undecaprenyl-diphosphatase
MSLTETLIGFDYSLFTLINHGLSNSLFDWFFPAITDLHKSVAGKILIPILVFSSLFWAKRIQGLWLGLSLCLCLALSDFTGAKLKNIFERSRPESIDSLDAILRSEAGHFSFPSNHSINMFCLAVFLGLFFPRMRAPLLFIASLIGISRVYNGVHFPSDVLAGAVIGSLIGFVGSLVTKKVLKWQKS